MKQWKWHAVKRRRDVDLAESFCGRMFLITNEKQTALGESHDEAGGQQCDRCKRVLALTGRKAKKWVLG
jgi:hypothetical protein